MLASEALAGLGISLRGGWRQGQHYTSCPWCKGRNRNALSVLVKADGHALWKCWRCEQSGSTARLVAEDERRIREALRQRRRPGPRPAPAPAPATAPKPLRIKPQIPEAGLEPETVAYGPRHAAFWDRCREITSNDVAGRYLTDRGCVLPQAGADLRWYPDLPHTWERHCSGPVMVGRITSILTGEPTSFHFTWLTPDGAGKAPLKKPRLLARHMTKQGGCIRLCDDADVGGWLTVGEGVETCLAGMRLLSMRPSWALIDSGNLKAFPVLDGIDWLVVLVDHDRPNKQTGKRAGIEAGQELRDRWLSAGRRVQLLIPLEEGMDVNDWVKDLAGPLPS